LFSLRSKTYTGQDALEPKISKVKGEKGERNNDRRKKEKEKQKKEKLKDASVVFASSFSTKIPTST